MRGPPQPCQPPCQPPQAEAEVGANAAAPSEAAAMATSESLRNMVHSFESRRGKRRLLNSRPATAGPVGPKRPIGRKPSFPKLNGSGTVASETVHQREIVVI